MKKILILWKYGLFLRYGKKRNTGKSALIGPFVEFSILAGLVYFLLSQIFPNGFEYSNIIATSFLIWTSFMSVMFFITTVGSALNVLSMGKETEFLLTLPLRRSEVVLYRILSITLLSIGAFGIHFGMISFYSVQKFGNPIPGILSFLIHLILLISLGTFVSVITVRYISGLRARQLFTLFQVIGVLPIIAISNVKSAQSFQEIVEKFEKMRELFSSPLNVFGYGISIMENPIYGVYAVALISALSYVILKLSKDVSFEIRRSRISHVRRKKFNVFQKELRAFSSGPTTLFQLIYPYAFAIMMNWQSRDIHSALGTALAFSITYVARESGYLTLVDVSRWNIVRSYPLQESKLVFWKIAVPVLLNLPFLVAIAIFASFIQGFSLYVLGLAVLTIFYQILGSAVGVKSILKSKPSSDDSREVYRSIGLLDTLPTIACGGSGIAGLGLIVYGKAMIGYVLLTVSVVSTVLLSWYVFKKTLVFLRSLDEE